MIIALLLMLPVLALCALLIRTLWEFFHDK